MRNIIELMQYKGVFEILHTIRFIPKKYNTIKQNIIQELSSRTLDHRLNELIEVGLIYKKNIHYSENQENFEYSLTEKGRIIECVFNSLQKLNFNLDFPSLIAYISSAYIQYQKYDWNNILNMILSILKNNPKIYTLSSQKLNIVESIDEKGLLVTTEKDTKLVEFGKIKQAYEYLLNDSILFLDDYEKATYRSSFICALLSQLDCVEVEYTPKIHLILKKNC